MHSLNRRARRCNEYYLTISTIHFIRWIRFWIMNETGCFIEIFDSIWRLHSLSLRSCIFLLSIKILFANYVFFPNFIISISENYHIWTILTPSRGNDSDAFSRIAEIEWFWESRLWKNRMSLNVYHTCFLDRYGTVRFKIVSIESDEFLSSHNTLFLFQNSCQFFRIEDFLLRQYFLNRQEVFRRNYSKIIENFQRKTCTRFNLYASK